MNSPRGTTPPQDKTSSRSTSKNDKTATDRGQASPLLDWLNQTKRDDPWHGFTIVSTESQQAKPQDSSTKENPDALTTRAEVGSDKGK
ncbi:hypothetical protein FLAG1_05750 [Fusarium langsethiae]|uniref:Uncharacterized protein n=1 Tax=Fusarium langsethiae TaxID=179993 RepID=A0A0M9EWJ2_FUSLA|nr:hypothetical protein FLAG1_05750 [Fusarium langsethiae]